jgi:hypothetical protein
MTHVLFIAMTRTGGALHEKAKFKEESLSLAVDMALSTQ